MNWFERHLNWTAGLVSLVLFPLVLVFSIAIMAFPGAQIPAIIVGVVNLGFLIYVMVWVLAMKNRSQGWMLPISLLGLTPLGLVIILLLKNRR